MCVKYQLPIRKIIEQLEGLPKPKEVGQEYQLPIHIPGDILYGMVTFRVTMTPNKKLEWSVII